MRDVGVRAVGRAGVALGLAGGLLLGSGSGTATAQPVTTVACDPLAATSTGVSVQPGTRVTLSVLGVPLASTVFTSSGTLTGNVGTLLGSVVCRVAVTVVAPVASAVPTAVTGPVASAVAPVLTNVPQVPVVVPGVVEATVAPAGPAVVPPSTTRSPATPPGGGGPAGPAPGNPAASPAAPAAGTPGSGPAAADPGTGAAPGLTLLGTASAEGGAAGSTPGRTPATGAGPGQGTLPALFGSPQLVAASGPAAEFGILDFTTAAQEDSSVAALDARLGDRPGVVLLLAVLVLAATAGCVVRQWALGLGRPTPVSPVTPGAPGR